VEVEPHGLGEIAAVGADQGLHLVGVHDPEGVVEADDIGPGVHQAPGQLQVVVVGDVGVQRKEHRGLRLLPEFLGDADGAPHVFQVVQVVVNPEDVHPQVGGPGDEFAHHFALKGFEAHQHAAPEDHLDGGPGQGPAHPFQALPGVLLEVGQGGVKSGAAPAVQGIKPGPVQEADQAAQIIQAQVFQDEIFEPVPEGDIGDFYGVEHILIISELSFTNKN